MKVGWTDSAGTSTPLGFASAGNVQQFARSAQDYRGARVLQSTRSGGCGESRWA